jgi:hypothetical protein
MVTNGIIATKKMEILCNVRMRYYGFTAFHCLYIPLLFSHLFHPKRNQRITKLATL